MQNIFHITKPHIRSYYMVDSLSLNAEQTFRLYFNRILSAHTTPVFICIGTPLLYSDSFGPCIGSQLKKQDIPNVFGTLEHPVHAENIEFYRNYIEKKYPHTPIVAIDASIGTSDQAGCITLHKGALTPGCAVGKKIPPIGHIGITGIFQNLHDTSSESFCLFMAHVVAQGITKSLL